MDFILTLAGRNTMKKANKRLNTLNLINADSIQECIENIREIKAYNQEEKYLNSVNKNIIIQEKSNIKTELITGSYVVSSQMLLRVGIATMTLVGAKLIVNSEIEFLTFLVFSKIF